MKRLLGAGVAITLLWRIQGQPGFVPAWGGGGGMRNVNCERDSKGQTWLRQHGGGEATATRLVTPAEATSAHRAPHCHTSRQRSYVAAGPSTRPQQLPLKPKGVGSLCLFVLRSTLVGDPVIKPKHSWSIKEPWTKIWHYNRTHYPVKGRNYTWNTA